MASIGPPGKMNGPIVLDDRFKRIGDQALPSAVGGGEFGNAVAAAVHQPARRCQVPHQQRVLDPQLVRLDEARQQPRGDVRLVRATEKYFPQQIKPKANLNKKLYDFCSKLNTTE